MPKKKDPVILVEEYIEFPGQSPAVQKMHKNKIVKILAENKIPVDAAGFVNYYAKHNGLPKMKGIGPEYSKVLEAAAKKIARKFKVKLEKKIAKK